jgi:NAD(P)-dependent dehydrogenase (short-subunit alcohol dehydrogenase family)
MAAKGPGRLRRLRVVLTGASRGIGRATALHLVRGGAHVLAVARESGPLSALAMEAKPLAGRIFPHSCDVGEPESAGPLVEAAEKRLGGVDALVNNAGSAVFGEIGELSPADFDATLAVCLRAPYLLTRALVPLMEAAGGDVINISSLAAVEGFPGSVAYCAAKAGLEGMSRALVEELRPKGIRVTVLRPGATATTMWETIPGEHDREKMIPPEVVAESVEYLLTQSRRAWCETLVLYPPDGKV